MVKGSTVTNHPNAPGNLHDEGNCPDCRKEAMTEPKVKKQRKLSDIMAYAACVKILKRLDYFKRNMVMCWLKEKYVTR